MKQTTLLDLLGETWVEKANRFIKLTKEIDSLGNTDWNRYVKILKSTPREGRTSKDYNMYLYPSFKNVLER